jgi:hypothetical protein
MKRLSLKEKRKKERKKEKFERKNERRKKEKHLNDWKTAIASRVINRTHFGLQSNS